MYFRLVQAFKLRPKHYPQLNGIVQTLTINFSVLTHETQQKTEMKNEETKPHFFFTLSSSTVNDHKWLVAIASASFVKQTAALGRIQKIHI